MRNGEVHGMPQLAHMVSKMITPRSISREVNESIPLPNTTLEIVLEDDGDSSSANAFNNGTALIYTTYLQIFTFYNVKYYVI